MSLEELYNIFINLFKQLKGRRSISYQDMTNLININNQIKNKIDGKLSEEDKNWLSKLDYGTNETEINILLNSNPLYIQFLSLDHYSIRDSEIEDYYSYEVMFEHYKDKIKQLNINSKDELFFSVVLGLDSGNKFKEILIDDTNYPKWFIPAVTNKLKTIAKYMNTETIIDYSSNDFKIAELSEEMLDDIDDMKSVKKLVDNINPGLASDDFCFKAIDKGYIFDDNSPKWICTCENVLYAIEQGQGEALDILDLSSVTEEEKKEIINIVPNAIDWGYEFGIKSPKWICTLDNILYAIKNGQQDAFEYMDFDYISTDKKNQVINMVRYAIDYGYKFNHYSPKYICTIENIKYATEKGQKDAYKYLNFSDISENQKKQIIDFMPTAINNGYRFYFNSPEWICTLDNIKYATEKGQKNAINFLSLSNMTEEEKKDIINMMPYVIDQGYYFDDQSPKYICTYENILYAIKKGQGRALTFLDLNNVTKEQKKEILTIVPYAIDQGYYFDNQSPKYICTYENILYAIKRGQAKALDYFDLASASEEEKKEILTIVPFAIDHGYNFNNNSSKWICTFDNIKYAIEKGQKEALSYLNFQTVKKDNEDELYKYLKNFINDCMVFQVIPIIDQLNFDKIKQYLGKEQLLTIKYLVKYNRLKTIYYSCRVNDVYKKITYSKMFVEELVKNKEYGILIDLINTNDEVVISLPNILKNAISKCADIQSDNIKKNFLNYIEENEKSINATKLDTLIILIQRIEYSNSLEIRSFSEDFLKHLLIQDDPIEAFNKFEKIFVKNNLPLMGKIFLSFKILYPNFEKKVGKINIFNFDDNSSIAPQYIDSQIQKLNNHESNKDARFRILFNDLLRISCKTEERSLIEYIDNIEKGYDLFKLVLNHKVLLNKEELNVLNIFINHLEVLYENIKNSKKINFEQLHLYDKIQVLNNIFRETSNYNLKDRIIRSFGYYAGIKNFNQMKEMIEEYKAESVTRLKKNAELITDERPFQFEEGDFIRCIGDINAFSGSLKYGNYCKELLTSITGSSGSDTTPLDVDFTMITGNDDIYHSIENTQTRFSLGNIFLVIKKDNPNFVITRDEKGKNVKMAYNPHKIEMFSKKGISKKIGTHWCARTGITVFDCDYILYKEKRNVNAEEPYDKFGNVNYEGEKDKFALDELAAIKYEITKKGKYVPIVDLSGKIIFTESEFENLREQMKGLSYFKESDYNISDNIITKETQEIVDNLFDSMEEIRKKELKVRELLQEILKKFNLQLSN